MYVKGVGPARAAMLEAKGLRVVEDLLTYAPFRYEDRTNVKPIRDLAPGEMATVLAEVRGEGLLIGVKAVVPSTDLVTALRQQHLLTVGAGENVVRFLPPLIVTEAEIDEAVQRLDRACTALSADQSKRTAAQ